MASNHVARITAGGLTNAPIAHSLFGTCETTGITAAKVATIINGDGPSSYTGNWSAADLFYGLTINIQFTHKNTVANPTLNINNSGAKPLMWVTGEMVSATYNWNDGDVVTLIYWPNSSTNGCWRILQPTLNEAKKYVDTKVASLEEVSISSTQPTDSGTKIWIKV